MMEQRMDLESFFGVVLRNVWVVVLLTAMGLGLALGAVLIQRPVWEAETSVVVSPLAAPPSGSLYGVEVLDLNIVGTYVQLLRSRRVLQDATAVLTPRYGEEQLQRALIDVRPVENSSVIVVLVRSRDRDLAVELADTVVSLAMESNPVPVLEQAYPMIVLDPAATGDDPAAPNVRLSLLLGTLAGGILGLGAAVVTDRRVGPRPARRAARSLA
jgi:receptor protein-tyrosine kinase